MSNHQTPQMGMLILTFYWLNAKGKTFTTLKGSKLYLKELGSLTLFDDSAIFYQSHFLIDNKLNLRDLVISLLPYAQSYQKIIKKQGLSNRDVLFFYDYENLEYEKLLAHDLKTNNDILLKEASFAKFKSSFVSESFVRKNLPGKCGLLLSQPLAKKNAVHNRSERLKKILIQFAQSRLELKSKSFLKTGESVKDLNLEQAIYERIFEGFGYKNFGAIFNRLAKDFPYAKIRKLWQKRTDSWHDHLLAYWLGKCDLLTHIPKNQQQILPLEDIRKTWKSFNEKSYHEKLNLSKINPNGHPVRRLLSMLQLLDNTKKSGLLASWLNIFKEIEKLTSKDWQSSKALKRIINALFKEVSNHSYLCQSLTGQARISVILVNAVLPFFLLLSKQLNKRGLSSLLFKIYYTFPGETGLNSLVRNMQTRLANPEFTVLFKNSLAYSQGMLQISKELCLNFHQGCQKCLLSGWLE